MKLIELLDGIGRVKGMVDESPVFVVPNSPGEFSLVNVAGLSMMDQGVGEPNALAIEINRAELDGALRRPFDQPGPTEGGC